MRKGVIQYMVLSSFSSSGSKYGRGPDLCPCTTRPESRSFRVDLGTPYIVAALFAGIPSEAAANAPVICSSVHCLRLAAGRHC